MTYKTRYLINAVNIFFQIFEKALDEPKYSSMYAQLCHQLCEDAPNFESSSSTISVSTVETVSKLNSKGMIILLQNS